VTIVDPRHPLFDQTFPLLHLKNKQEMVPCCLVQLAEGVERLVPISVTSLAASLDVVFPLPLDISSLHKLTQVFVRLQAQIEEKCGDGRAGNAQLARSGRSDAGYLGNANPNPAGNVYTDAGADMLPNRRSKDTGGGS
jgi:hypothetical protein